MRLISVLFAVTYAIYNVLYTITDLVSGGLPGVMGDLVTLAAIVSMLAPFALLFLRIFKGTVERSTYLVLAGIAGVLNDRDSEVPLQFRTIIYKIDHFMNLKLRCFLPTPTISNQKRNKPKS